MKENADRARGLDAAELNKELREGSEQMFRLRFQMSMGQMEGVKKLRALKKERARMLTVLRERELSSAPQAATPAKGTPVKGKPVKTKPAAAAKPKPAAAASAKAVAKPKIKSAAAKTEARRAAPKAAAKPKTGDRARKTQKG
jgi:large subunit ribosomal protein L29